MRRKTISLLVGTMVMASVIFAILYLRGGTVKSMLEDNFSSVYQKSNSLAQAGEPDDVSKAFAEMLKEQTGVEYDANYIVSTGKSIREGNFIYEVNSWRVQKEMPTYQMPSEMQEMMTYHGAELDESGNIQNDLSYVVVNMTVENQGKAITNYIWGTISLKITNIGTDQYTGEILYLGEDVSKEYNKDYYREIWQEKESKTKVLIYIVKDEWLMNNQMYMEINSSGAVTISPDYDPRRYIILN